MPCSTHALVMDAGVLDCVLECMCEDFKRFMEHPANASTSEEAARADRVSSSGNLVF